MKVSISQNAVEHVVIAAALAFAAVVLPQAAGLVGNGFQASDLAAANAVGGAGVAAALRALILFIPAKA